MKARRTKREETSCIGRPASRLAGAGVDRCPRDRNQKNKTRRDNRHWSPRLSPRGRGGELDAYEIESQKNKTRRDYLIGRPACRLAGAGVDRFLRDGKPEERNEKKQPALVAPPVASRARGRTFSCESAKDGVGQSSRPARGQVAQGRSGSRGCRRCGRGVAGLRGCLGGEVRGCGAVRLHVTPSWD